MSALKSEFKAVPDQNDLTTLPRDLRFHPATNDRRCGHRKCLHAFHRRLASPWALTYRPSGSHEHNVLNQTIENAEQYGTVVNDCLPSGPILDAHRPLAPRFRGEPIDTPSLRPDAALRGRRGARLSGLEPESVWVSGGDSRWHWANRPRPKEECFTEEMRDEE